MIRVSAATLTIADDKCTLPISNNPKAIAAVRFRGKSTANTTSVLKVQGLTAGTTADWLNIGYIDMAALQRVASGNVSLADSTDFDIQVPDTAGLDAVRAYLVSNVSGSFSVTPVGLFVDEVPRTFQPVTLAAATTNVSAASATALTVGPNGTTSPSFVVDSSASSAVDGWKITGNATGTNAKFVVISSATNEGGSIDAKGSSVLALADTSTGGVGLNRGSRQALMVGMTVTALGTVQSSTPTSAQILGGVLTQTSATGAGTITLPTGTALSTACPRTPATGDTFDCMFANLGGSQTLTVTGATGTTVAGGATIATAKSAILRFYCTGSNSWTIYTIGG